MTTEVTHGPSTRARPSAPVGSCVPSLHDRGRRPHARARHRHADAVGPACGPRPARHGRLWSARRCRTDAGGLPSPGAFFALTPAQYLPVAGGAAFLLGWSEWRLGTRRVVIAAVASHLVGVLLAALLLLPLSSTGWGWAQRTAEALDVGFSAGVLGAVAAASVTLRPPWRGRVRLLLSLSVVVAFLYIGALWDLEHLLAVGFGLAIGPFLVGRRPVLTGARFSRHEWRMIAFTGFLIAAAIRLVLYFMPSDGPLGATTADSSAVTVLVGAAVSVLLANGLRRGSRRGLAPRRRPVDPVAARGRRPAVGRARGPRRAGRGRHRHRLGAGARPRHRAVDAADRRARPRACGVPRAHGPPGTPGCPCRDERPRHRRLPAAGPWWHDDVVDGHVGVQPLVHPA